MKRKDAIAQAVSLLEDEANSLACLQNDPKFRDLPHRARVAISREITRFREIAKTISPSKRNE